MLLVMANRAPDWLAQAQRDFEHAEQSRGAGRHEWACFAAQQAAEKAVKALHLHAGQGTLGSRGGESPARAACDRVRPRRPRGKGAGAGQLLRPNPIPQCAPGGRAV